MLLSIGSVLNQIIPLALAAGLFYLFFRFNRIVDRRLGISFLNPFQPGWKQLHKLYGITARITRPTEWVLGRTGRENFNLIKGLKIRFEAEHMILQNVWVSASLVQIPYADMEVLRTPKPSQVTRFSKQEYTPGLFKAGGVEVELQAYWADQLLKQMVPAPVA
jgi:hypothetical protein